MSYTPTVLTIAGSDNYAGAGIEIDSKTIHSLGAYALNSTTALTAQNSTGVKSLLPTTTKHFKAQLDSILSDIHIDALKIGMLSNIDILQATIEAIKKYDLKNIVVDTVLISSSGRRLLEVDAIEMFKKELFPLADIITPNIPEINILLNIDYDGTGSHIESISQELKSLKSKYILLKGGHSTDESSAIDYLTKDGKLIKSHSANRVNTTHTHGTGCILSSAIATYLALGYPMTDSVSMAKDFLTKKLEESDKLKIRYLQDKTNRKEPIF